MRRGWPILTFVFGLMLGAFIYEAEKPRRIQIPFPPAIALERLAAQLPAAQSRVIIVRFGNPAREIAALARRVGADLIVMGTHGRSMMARLFQGSIAEKVIANAPCPVFTLPPDTMAEAPDIASQAA